MKIADTIDLDFVKAWAEDIAWEATRRVAEELGEEAATQAPVDTGELKASIIVQEDRAAKVFRVIADTPYAVYVEYGFVHWISGMFIGPNPFFRRAIEIVRNRFGNINISAIRSRVPANKGS